MQAERVYRIRKNFIRLVRETNLDTLLPELVRRNVITDQTISQYQSRDKRINVRRLYLDVGMLDWDPYELLLESMRASGQGHLADWLEGPIPEDTPSSGASLPRPSHAVPFTMPMHELQRSFERQLTLPVIIDTNTEPLVVRVTPSTRFSDENSNVPVYRTRSKHRGVALVINNIKFDFDDEEERKGAHVDGKNLVELFRQCGIHVKYRENLTGAGIKHAVREHARDEGVLGGVDVAFCVFMSHGSGDFGKQSSLKGTDGVEVTEHWIVSQFNNRNCRALLGKPKIFIFQMCRGDNLDFRTQTDGVPQNRSQFPPAGTTMSDVLIAHSTLPGFKSHRDIFEGSWYISCLCKIFMEHAHDCHVEQLLKMVQDKLKMMVSANMTSQTSTFLNVGFKCCYLHPGIYEEEGVLKRFSN